MDASLARIPSVFAEYLSHDEKILTGVSGGSDSVSLLYLLAEHLPGFRERVFVVHVNHGLRPEAAEDESLTLRHCRCLGVACLLYRQPVAEIARQGKLSLEEAGRWARHECFLDAARTLGAGAVVLAHHLDDQAETLLLNLFRGAGSQGLSAMHFVRPFPHPESPAGLRLIRPLLGVSKSALEHYLRERKLAWRNDATNQDKMFTRNRIRKIVLPLLEREFNPQIKSLLAHSAESLARDDRYLNQVADRALRRAVLEQTSSRMRLLLARLRPLPDGLLWRLLARAWDEMKIPGKSGLHLDHLAALVRHRAADFSLPGQWQAQIRGDALIFFRPWVITSQTGKYAWNLKGELRTNPGSPYGVQVEVFARSRNFQPGFQPKPCQAWLDADKSGTGMVVRSGFPRDYIRPLGMNGRRKAVGKIFSELKIPHEQKKIWPVLARGSEVYWIWQGPLSETVKISAETRTILRICIVKK